MPGIVIQIKGDGEGARQALEMVQEQMRRTAEQAEESGGVIAGAMEKVGQAVEYLGIYEGIRVLLDGMKELVAGSVELGVEIGHLSKQTGISAENLSVLKYMSDETGVGMDSLTKGFKKLSVEMLGAEEGKKQAIDTFARLGISEQEVTTHSRDLYGMLGLIADKFQQLPDGPRKAAEAQQLFGKAGMQLIPILNQGSAGVEEFRAKAQALGLILSEETIEKMEQLHETAMQTQAAMEGLGLTLTDVLSPFLKDIALGATMAVEKLQELVGLMKSVDEAGAVGKQKAAYDKIPDKVLGMGDVQNFNTAQSSQKRIDAAQQELSRLEGLRERNAISEAQYAAKSLALQKETDDARLALAEVNVAAQERIDVGSRTSADKAQLANAYKALIDAQKRSSGDRPDLELQPSSSGKKGDGGIPEAMAALIDAQSNARAALQKVADQVQLAELENQHKLLIVSDEAYYAEKIRLQNEELDAEADALRAKQKTLSDLYNKQHNDKSLRTDKSGTSSQELKTQRDLVQVGEQLAALDARRAQLSSTNITDVAKNSEAAELASLKVAAELEKERNNSVAARIALQKYETDQQVKQVRSRGGSDSDVANVQATGQLISQKLQLADIDRQIEEIQQQSKENIDQINTRVKLGVDTKRQGAQETAAANKAEVQLLSQLVAQYDALAKVVGGDALQKAAAFHSQVTQLSTPNNKDNAALGKTLSTGVADMAKNITDQSLRGKNAFKDMAQSIEKDSLDLAVKLATQKWLTPALEGAFNMGGSGDPDGGGFWAKLFGAGAEHHMSGGTSSDGSQVIGEDGPEIWTPPTGGGTITPNNMITSLAQSSGGGQAPNIAFNLSNQSSTPVTATPGQMSYDAEFGQYVQHVVLTDLSSNGPIAQGMRSAS